MVFSFKSGTTLISDYIIECERIPVKIRNRDFVPIIPEFTMLVSEKVDIGLIGEGDKISVFHSTAPTVPFWVGNITRVRYESDKRAYRVSVIHLLNKLTERYVTHDELNAVITAGATAQQYLASDNQGYPSVQVIWVLEKMFDQVGLNLYTTGLGARDIETIVFDATNRLIEVQHLRICENMMYAINQPVATLYTTLDANNDYLKNRITFWDFFAAFCSFVGPVGGTTIGYTVNLSEATSEQILLAVPSNTLLSLSDDDILEEETDSIPETGGGYQHDILFADRSAYASGTETNLTSHQSNYGDSKNEIQHYTNFVYMYEKWWESAGYVLGLGAYPSYCLPAGTMLYNKINANVAQWDAYKWKVTGVDISSKGAAKNIYVDPVDVTTEFEQEILR